ncbi:Serine/threonine-protein kinase CLA4 [Psilocybe cubensis]|uniref:non-specific serine/threonine protein kinase n=2 Tax=Psilocybe cubensis TaxID=181762 RepID=A0A8H8CRA8_PSICU|nr:Serine/threonine-protein kinase CLA4 [Psilocybe cubensis]KAH9487383.1 Serine/threonine-protein kinase CLA4 [Psilocybe cubensis]
MDYKPQSPYKRTKGAAATVPPLVRSGSANLLERSTFSGTTWKPKRLELDSESLTIINPSSNKRTRISLQDITELERTDLADHALELKTKIKRYNFSFTTDSELYDWQDDIYQRCPLGNYSAPFDFVHKSHIGSDSVAGTFTDANILPIYAEIIGGQPAVSKTSPSIVASPRSRPASASPLAAVPKGSSSPSHPVLDGLFAIKQTGLFAGWLWKERWLTLTPQALVIHRRSTKSSPASKSIPLPALTRIDIDVKRDNCLIVEFTTRPSSSTSSGSVPTDILAIVFKGNTNLYEWRDALYLRSALSSPIGNPTSFVHHVHVGFDPVTGAFTGLPAEWNCVNPGPSPSSEKKARRQSRRRSAPLVASN